MHFALTVLIVSSVVSGGFGFEFEDAGTPGVALNRSSGSNAVWNLYVDENNKKTQITFLKITGAKNKTNLYVDVSNMDNSEIGMELDKSSDAVLLKGFTLDYEKAKQKTFKFNVYETGAGGQTKDLNLFIINLDDEPPTFTASSNCRMTENHTITIDNVNDPELSQSCTFQISDPDGFLDKMDFSHITDGGSDSSKLFSFQYKGTPSGTSSPVFLVLQPGKLLDYEEVTMHMFEIRVKDGAGHSTVPNEAVQIIVKVKDINDMPPIWVQSVPTLKIPEKQPHTFSVLAKDGDFEVNSPIEYTLTDPKGFVSIDRKTGKVTIAWIDRDVPNNANDIIYFTITATETDNPPYNITEQVTLIVEDIDDNVPLITINGTVSNNKTSVFKTSILENRTDPVNAVITIEDKDLGNNAMYTVQLLNLNNNQVNYASAFQIVPSDGYQKGPFSLNIQDVSKLDFDAPNEAWREIKFKIKTTEKINSTMTDEYEVHISLIDWNDEWPIFAKDSYTVSLRENVDLHYVVNPKDPIKATDRDADDKLLNHTLVGTIANSILEIEPYGGLLKTTQRRSFDYEKEKEVLLQIRTQDKANHMAQTQLKIIVEDVNDETPKFMIDNIGTFVEENQHNGTILNYTIKAFDEDTTAKLEFSIDWAASYVSKNSRKLDRKPEFEWLVVNTRPGSSNHEAFADLMVHPVQGMEKDTPDYEVYDTSYVTLVITDLNTEEGPPNATVRLIITIGNINDNPPIFTNQTKAQNLTVMENALGGTVIGIVTATDADNDEIKYYMQGQDSEIEINDGTGQLTVKNGATIDCDEPKKYFLNYTVIASDGLHNTTLQLAIFIIDQNDNKPEAKGDTFDYPEDNQLKEETSNGTIIHTLEATDKDRDSPNNDVQCTIDNSNDVDVKDRFTVQTNQSGHNFIELVVLLSNSATLDREKKPDGYKVQLYCVDNPEKKNSQIQNAATNAPVLQVHLTDVNDNYPRVIPETFSFDENQNQAVSKTVRGVDEDLAKNGEIEFTMTKIAKFTDPQYQNSANDPNCGADLFTLESDKEKSGWKTATLKPKKPLKGCYGYYILSIATEDHGEPKLKLENNTLKVEIAKFNFQAPTVIFPKEGTSYYLAKNQQPNQRLRLYNGRDFLPELEATDNQSADNKDGSTKYTISFALAPTSQHADLFQTVNFGKSKGDLQLRKIPSAADLDKQYDLILQASIGDTSIFPNEASYKSERKFTIKFFDSNSPPTFSYAKMEMSFKENTTEQQLTKPLQAPASYPGVDIANLEVYYHLVTANPFFSVNISTGFITLDRPTELDYEDKTEYSLTIQASNGPTPVANPVNGSEIVVHIAVIDINDNPPNFLKPNYLATLLTGGVSDTTVILTVNATDLDTTSNGQLRYKITEIVDKSQNVNPKKPEFSIEAVSGQIKSNFQVPENANGYFDLSLLVHDEWENHTDTAKALIYIVSKENTVKFRFDNPQVEVISKAPNCTLLLDSEFKCQSAMEIGKVLSDDREITTAPFYFVDETAGKPITSEQILRQVANTEFYNKMKRDLNKIGLNLLSFDTDNNNKDNTEEILRAWLIGVSVVLGVLFVAVLVAFVLRTRMLSKRIKNLSSTKFGSQESGLNRVGIAVPTSNKHAVEGSNPVYQTTDKKPDLDRISVGSGDSGLIGVEDNGEFDYNYPSKDNVHHSSS